MFPRVTERIVHWLIDRLVPLKTPRKNPWLCLQLPHRPGIAALPQDALMIFFTTVIIWLLETGKYWFVMHAFPGLEVSFFALMLMNGIVNLATTLPSAPATSAPLTPRASPC